MYSDYDPVKKKQRDDALDAAKKTAVSAGTWGGVYGALDNMLSGNRSLGGIAARGLGTGATAAALGGGAAYLGHKLIGPPAEGDPSAAAKQGAVGGTAGGAAIGGAGGYLLGSGKLRGLADLPHAEKAAHYAKMALPLDNLAVDWIKKQAKHPSHAGGLKMALALGLVGAGIGGLKGFETGSEQDTKRNLSEENQYAG